ncbi:GNAT family N-acetyltransferase [Prochlorococcus sp. MIT 1223]|uniref:GNAT family N-acetyltransferase n=1 Tax=Prochlorococcus sp. MIT 1223 TaxID=3096217 RepID=UPI002A7566F7|nr:GNAT family N-acetyltransferase [Prochlorococcus sp. MIT 1223]
MAKLIYKWNASISEIDEKDWDYLLGENSNPFYSWKWLYALENSKSIVATSGWQPLYLSVWREFQKNPVAIAPLFLKGHSYGEFIFDNQFEELANQLGKRYYPKLIGMSPVSPVEGYRFLFSNKEDKLYLTREIINQIDSFCVDNNILSCNFLYVDPSWQVLAEKANCATWLNKTSIWEANENKNFSDYLLKFNSNQRKNIKKERNSIKKANINVSVKYAEDINLQDMQMMHDFYESHCSRWGIWGSKYLSRAFFEQLALEKYRNEIVLFSANKSDEIKPIAMSLCITNGEKLWGRYWGSKLDIDFLHFELCYYSPIEWAFTKGIKSFDPGAGGSQKKRRGFIAKPSASLHRWYEPNMDKLIRAWLCKSNKLMLEEIKATNNEVPFKKDNGKLSLMT